MNHLTPFRLGNSARAAALLVAGLLLSWNSSGAEQTPRPTPQQLLEQAQRCRSILQTSMVDFYLPACVDRENGGYLESLRDGRFAPTGEKFLTLQGRQLWFFSTLAIEGIAKEKALEAARTGFVFLEEKMRDSVEGGYFSKVTDAGAARDNRKHAYLNSFALYGLTAYYRASQDPRALESAKRLFRVLDQKAHDSKHGGYVEFFHADWTPVTSSSEQGYVGAIGRKTFNTHLHLLESFAELYRVWPDELLGRRLHELIAINTSTVRFPKVESNVDAFFADWKVVTEPANLRASYGHDVECVWLTLDAVRTLGMSSDVYTSWARALCQSSIEFGYDREHGGFYSSGPLLKPADDKKKIWWVQSEALVSMLDMFKLTGEAAFYDLFAQTLDFVEKHHVAKEGSWWATRAADGSATADRQRTGPWQGGYHAGRSMILCAKLLEDLARASSASEAADSGK